MTEVAAGCINPALGVLLPSYEMGGLTDAQISQFEHHMGECRPCTEEMRSMQAIFEMLRAHPDLPIHPERYIQERSFFAGLSWQPVAMAAAAMLCLVLGLGFFRPLDAWREAGMIALGDNVAAHRCADDLVSGVNALKAGHIDEAKGIIERHVRLRPGSYQGQYFLGVCRLQEADQGFLGMRRVDAASVARAAESFEQAAALASQNDDPIYEARARLGLAKVYLLRQDRARARAELGKIQGLDTREKFFGQTDLEKEAQDLSRSVAALKERLR